MSDKHNFYRHVSQRASELRDTMDGLMSPAVDASASNAAITQCLTEINNLKLEISTHAHETAPHDQRTFNEILKGLKKELEGVRSKVAPKRKFAFKPKPRPASTDQSSEAIQSFPVADSSSQLIEDPLEHPGQEPSASGSRSLAIQQPSVLNDLRHALRTENSFDHAEQGVMIANSSHCVIKCLISSPRLTINEVQSSVVVVGPINGAALVIEMTATVLVISCRQLRLHHCRNCILYLRCSSRPIIEDCSDMQFAPFPNDLDIAPLDGTISDYWDQVDDFNWLKAGHSPNWSKLEPEYLLGTDHWKQIQSVADDQVGEVLQAFKTTRLPDQGVASK